MNDHDIRFAVSWRDCYERVFSKDDFRLYRARQTKQSARFLGEWLIVVNNAALRGCQPDFIMTRLTL